MLRWRKYLSTTLLLCVGFILVSYIGQAQIEDADNPIVEICPSQGIVPRSSTFEPGGIILTTFDKLDLWVYDIDNNRRYPLPDSHPCGANCRLSPDARWITYHNPTTRTFDIMRLNGTDRRPFVDIATEVHWWDSETLLVWTPGHEAYLRPIDTDERTYLNTQGAISIQPGGVWGVVLEQQGDSFLRKLVYLDSQSPREDIILGEDLPYFNAHTWSNQGWLAYVAPVVDSTSGYIGGEIFGIHPEQQAVPQQWTHFNEVYGAVRINGYTINELSWSPNGRYIAFWVMELLGPNPETDAGNAVIHILDTVSGEIRRYCGFATLDHTPNPPRLAWSPDSTHIAFGGDVDYDTKGYLLLALDIETGELTELSNGLYPAQGTPYIVAWGERP